MSLPRPSNPTPDFHAVWRESGRGATRERVQSLAAALGVSPAALEAIGIRGGCDARP